MSAEGHTCTDYNYRSCKACYPPPAPWTEAHMRESRIALRKLATRADLEGCRNLADGWTRAATHLIEDEGALRYHVLLGKALNAADVDKIVRDVRDLAEGRRVREVVWRGESGEEYASREDAAKDKSHGGATFARIARIRRAP